MKRASLHLLLTLCPLLLHGESARAVRTWTDAGGRTLQAALLGFDSGQVTLQFPDGKTVRLQAMQLSAADRDFIGQNIGEVFDPITGKAIQLAAPRNGICAGMTMTRLR